MKALQADEQSLVLVSTMVRLYLSEDAQIPARDKK